MMSSRHPITVEWVGNVALIRATPAYTSVRQTREAEVTPRRSRRMGLDAPDKVGSKLWNLTSLSAAQAVTPSTSGLKAIALDHPRDYHLDQCLTSPGLNHGQDHHVPGHRA